MTHLHIFPFFIFIFCQFVVLYIIFLEVAYKFSHFCKMARKLKVVGPCCSKINKHAS